MLMINNNYNLHNSNIYLNRNVKSNNQIRFTCNDLRLSCEVSKALSSADTPYLRSYLENFSDMASLIFRTNSEKDVIKTLQMIIDKISKNENIGRFLKNKYIEIVYKGTCPNVGTAKYLNTESLQNILQYTDGLTSSSKKMILDIINESMK